MKLDGTMLLLAAGGFLLLSSRGGSGFGAGGLITLPNGQRIGSDGTVYNAQGQPVGRTSPTNYVRAVASQGKASGQPAAQTLATIKSTLATGQTIFSFGQSLFNTISSVFSSPTMTSHDTGGVTTADILRDRIIADPETAAPPGTSVSTADILREPEQLDEWFWAETPYDVPPLDESWLAEMEEMGGWENPITYEPIDWQPEVTWEEAYDVAW